MRYRPPSPAPFLGSTGPMSTAHSCSACVRAYHFILGLLSDPGAATAGHRGLSDFGISLPQWPAPMFRHSAGHLRRYEGQWLDDKRHGRGTCAQPATKQSQMSSSGLPALTVLLERRPRFWLGSLAVKSMNGNKVRLRRGRVDVRLVAFCCDCTGVSEKH